MLIKFNKEEYTFHNRLKEIRARYNITQDGLAIKIGVSRQTILFIEKGKFVPSLHLGLLIASCFETDINNIFYLQKKGKK